MQSKSLLLSLLLLPCGANGPCSICSITKQARPTQWMGRLSGSHFSLLLPLPRILLSSLYLSCWIPPVLSDIFKILSFDQPVSSPRSSRSRPITSLFSFYTLSAFWFTAPSFSLFMYSVDMKIPLKNLLLETNISISDPSIFGLGLTDRPMYWRWNLLDWFVCPILPGLQGQTNSTCVVVIYTCQRWGRLDQVIASARSLEYLTIVPYWISFDVF